MVLIRDYDDGWDFAAAGGVRQTRGTVMLADDAGSAALFRTLIEDPSVIDFRRFSRAGHPNRDGYDFSVKALVAALR